MMDVNVCCCIYLMNTQTVMRHGDEYHVVKKEQNYKV